MYSTKYTTVNGTCVFKFIITADNNRKASKIHITAKIYFILLAFDKVPGKLITFYKYNNFIFYWNIQDGALMLEISRIIKVIKKYY